MKGEFEPLSRPLKLEQRLLKQPQITDRYVAFVSEYEQMGLTKPTDINPLNMKRRLLYLKTQFVPRSKHFSSRL